MMSLTNAQMRGRRGKEEVPTESRHKASGMAIHHPRHPPPPQIPGVCRSSEERARVRFALPQPPPGRPPPEAAARTAPLPLPSPTPLFTNARPQPTNARPGSWQPSPRPPLFHTPDSERDLGWPCC